MGLVIRKDTQKSKITYVGGSLEGGLGPSSYMIEDGDSLGLIDLGLEFTKWPADTHPLTKLWYPKKVQGPVMLRQILNGRKINWILVTHLHLDHAGGLPLAVEFLETDAKIYADPLTNAGLEIVLRDTLKFSPYVYDVFEVDNILRRRVDLPLGEYELAPGRKIFSKKAGHLLGARSFLFKEGMITGDMSTHVQPTVDGAQFCSQDVPPEWMPKRILGMDLTHGLGTRTSWDIQMSRLAEQTEKVLARGGKAIIAAFGFGRGQNIALALARKGFTVYIDGVIRRVLALYESMAGIHVDHDKIRWVHDADHREKLIETDEPIVVITTAGMADAGPIIGYLIRSLPEKKDAVFFTSWVAPDSNAMKIMQRSTREGSRIQLETEEWERITVPIVAEIDRFHLTAHADTYDLFAYFDDIARAHRGRKLQSIALTHGTSESQRAATRLFARLADDIIIGEPGLSVSLN